MARRGGFRIDWTTAAGALAFLIVGGGFMTLGAWQIVTNLAFLQRAVPVQTVVVANVETCDDDGCTWWPTLRFTDPMGDTRDLRTRFGSSDFGWEEGERLEALFSPGYDYVQIPGFGNLWLLGGAFFLLGAMAVGMAFFPLGRLAIVRRPETDDGG